VVPLFKHLEDHLLHILSTLQDVRVPESKHAPAVPLKPRRATRIRLAIGVLPTVGLDHHAMLDACEIHDEWAQRMLAAKLVADEASTP
jgi:hypothetical protein